MWGNWQCSEDSRVHPCGPRAMHGRISKTDALDAIKPPSGVSSMATRARGGSWALGFRLWALGSGLWALALGSGVWALGSGLWALTKASAIFHIDVARVLGACPRQRKAALRLRPVSARPRKPRAESLEPKA